LKEKVFIGSVDLRDQGHVYVFVLFTRDLQSTVLSFRREGLDLEGLSLIERKFDLKESLSLRSDSSFP